MQSEPVSPLGGYRPGHSPLHGIDPRVKLLLALVLIVASFAGPGPLRMILLSLTGLAGAGLAGLGLASLLKAFRPLRWLLLFTVLLHALFSPGHTLFGLGWLSRDGLLHGCMVAWGLLLALLFSTLLTLTTPPEQLAAALARLLRPLERLGVPVAAAAEQVLLVLYFIPVLQQEAEAVRSRPRPPAIGWSARLETARELLAELLNRLAGHAEELAAEGKGGEALVAGPVPLPPVHRWRRAEWALLFLGVLFLIQMVAGR